MSQVSEASTKMPADTKESQSAIIIGAGPAGLTAALELLERTGIVPIVLEKSEFMGGISRTVNYKGNRMDIGGHRFFSKSDRVMEWWKRILPVEGGGEEGSQTIQYRSQSREIDRDASAPDARTTDRVMLVRQRKSRIFYLRKFFDYPIRLTVDTIRKLGLIKVTRIGLSYGRSVLHPIRPERTLEHFFINRFGRELYRTFFESYTEKVWGVPCNQISAEWGAQRIKGLSVLKTLAHAIKKTLRTSGDVAQRKTETSLIERFLYPKFGPGQMWEEVARRIVEKGGVILTGWKVERIERAPEGRILSIEARHSSGEARVFRGQWYFSTMPVKELIANMTPSAPHEIQEIARGLQYRDFITVGLLCERLSLHDVTANGTAAIRDNWIYIQEPDVLVGRLQIFNNWSPYMVQDPNHVWIGLEYFCNEGDGLWRRTDQEMLALGKEELERMGIARAADIVDGTVIRMEKTYPAYFGAYERFDEVKNWVNGHLNLFLIGRNGMHKYNNQDHSMLTAMVAVDNIIAGVTDRDNLWALNTEQEYHEDKQPAAAP